MMKRLFVVVLMAICVVTCSCGKGTSIYDSLPKSIENFRTESLAYSTSSDVEIKLFMLSTMSEYKKLLKADKLPSNFVRYEDIKAIGDFENLVFLCDVYSGDYSAYMYGLRDSAGADMVLYVYANPNYSSISITDISNEKYVDYNDMRTIPVSITGEYIYENISYRYVSGHLSSFSWKNDGITYVLSDDFADYPNDRSTFVGKLLNVNTAQDAIQSVNNIADK